MTRLWMPAAVVLATMAGACRSNTPTDATGPSASPAAEPTKTPTPTPTPIPGMGPCPTCRFDKSLRKVVGLLEVSDDFVSTRFDVQWMKLHLKNSEGTTAVETAFSTPKPVDYNVEHAVVLSGTIIRVQLEYKDAAGVVEFSEDIPFVD